MRELLEGMMEEKAERQSQLHVNVNVNVNIFAGKWS